jgi:hypothetical protein
MVYDAEGNMIITLDDKELTDALVAHVKDKYGLGEANTFSLKLKSGRNSPKRVNHGNQATITVSKLVNPNQLEMPLEEPVSPSEEVSVTQVLVEPVEASTDVFTQSEEEELLEEEPVTHVNPSFNDIERIREPEDKPSFKSLFA